MTPISEWQNFYVILGAAAGSLTGLQFIAMALVAEMPISESETESTNPNAAFATPSIVHFGTVLFLAAVLVMPWHSIAPPTIVYGIAGCIGMAYTALIGWRFKRQTSYQPVLEDWFYRFILPLAAYAVLTASAFITHAYPRPGLFTVAAVALALLFIGIHNAWDNVTYLVTMKRQKLNSSRQNASS